MNKYIFKKNFPWHEVNKANKNARHNHPDSRNHLEHINTPFRPFYFFFLFYFFITKAYPSKNLGIGSPPSHILPFFKETQEWISSCNAFNDFFDSIFILCLKKGYQSLKSIQIHITKWKAVEWNPLLAGGGQFTISAPPCIFSTGHSE